MDTIFQKIGAVIVGVAMIVGGWMGYKPEQPFGASTSSSDVIALFETTLASRITSSATSLTLTSATDEDGNVLASSTYGMIIDEGTASEELILADCTSTACTNLTRGLSVRTGTTTIAALQKEHRRGASIKITDAPALIFAMNVFRGKQNVDKLMNYDSDLSIASTSRAIPYASWVIGQTNTASTSAFRTILDSINTFSLAQTFTSTSTFSLGARTTTAGDCQVGADTLTVCSKSYVDSVAVAGASDADYTTKGIVEQATVQEINSKTLTGSTGAILFMNPFDFQYSAFASTTDDLVRYATSTASTYIAKTFEMTTSQVAFIWASAMGDDSWILTRFGYKWATDLATTSLSIDDDPVVEDFDTFFHILQASTTNTVTVEIEATNAGVDNLNIGALIFNP